MNCILPYMVASFCSVIITRADVTFKDIVDFNVDITQTSGLGVAIVETTVDNEIDNITFGWNDSMRTPLFHDFYDILFLSSNPQYFVGTIIWDSDKTPEERKQAGGVVLCEAVKGGSTLESITFTISVVWLPQKPNIINDDPVIAGATTALICDTPDIGSPGGRIVWIKDGNNYTGPGSTNTSLYLPVTKKDDGTSWECYYYNMEGKSETSGASILNVNWRPEQPNISTTSENSNLRIGNTTKLECILTDKGNPVGQINWKRNSAISRSTEEPLLLTIDKQNNGDNWCCYYNNSVGNGPCSSDIHLIVYWIPETPTIIFPDSSELNIGQKVKLTCQLADTGNPRGQVVWLRNGTVMSGSTYTDATVDFFVNPGHNGSEWCCYYNNSIGKGPDSDCEQLIITSTIPIVGEIIVTSTTAKSLNISIDNSRIDLDTYHAMNVSWRSNTSMETVYEMVYSNITYKLLADLEPETFYIIQFAFVHDGDTGRYEEISGSTESVPVTEDPLITREWLSATCTVNVADPDSEKIVTCGVCSPDGTNCIHETKTYPAKQVTKRSTQEEVIIITVKDNSFSRRLVNVSVYDSGVLVYDYSDNIDAPVAAIVLIALGAVLVVAVMIFIIIILIKKTGKGKQKPRKEVEEEISPYGHTNPATTNESRTGTGHETKTENLSSVYSVVNKGKPLAPIAASPADGDVYSQVDWSKKTKRPSLKGLPMSTKAIDKITFSKTDGSINMHLEVRKKFTGEIEINVCREGDQSSKSKESKQHVGGTKNVNMVLPIEETSQDKYTIRMKFIAKGQMVQEVNLTYPYEQNAVHVTVMNDAYVTSGTDVKASEMPEYSEVNKSKKTKGSEMPIYSEVNKPKKKKKAAEEQPYEDVETKNQSSHNERSTNAVSPSNAEVAVEGVPPHPPRKGAPKEGVMYAELDLNSSGAPRLLPRLGSKSPAQEPVIYADVRPGQKDVV